MTDLPTSGTISYSGTIDDFVVGTTGVYTIDAVGAIGGQNGGAGASVEGAYALTAGDTIEILVGQAGQAVEDGGSGGGGTFVYDDTTNTLLEVAGGGGGGSAYSGQTGEDAQTGTSGGDGGNIDLEMQSGAGGAGGEGGAGGGGGSGEGMFGLPANQGASGGGGYSGDGSGDYNGTSPGLSFQDGGAAGNSSEGPAGGFGGGGGSDNFSGGGGGGYSGGGGGGAFGGAGGGGGSYSSDLSATITGGANTSGDGYVDIISEAACYARGTRILTENGEVPIERLAIGDRVMTLSGEARPIIWLGHRGLDCRRHVDPPKVWPIRVSAGAFAPNVPLRDLWLSPGHNIAFEGALVPIRNLQNGLTVVQVERPTVEYWHVELEWHDIIIADGLPAESYLESGNRTAFVEGGDVFEAHPDFEPRRCEKTCLPMVYEGSEVIRAKAALLDRLGVLGTVATDDADMHVMASGRRIDPLALGPMRFAFVPPADGTEIALVSRTFIPARALANSTDDRSLGVCVKRLQIDGEEVALDGEHPIQSGWHEPEPGRRWTRGHVPLPSGTRLVVVDLAGRGYYWQSQYDNVVALSV